jgi:ankyrin repeat protein
MTALMTAASRGRTEISKSLIDAGASLDLKNHYQKTALIEAAILGSTKITK